MLDRCCGVQLAFPDRRCIEEQEPQPGQGTKNDCGADSRADESLDSTHSLPSGFTAVASVLRGIT